MRVGFDITPLTVPLSGVGTYTASLLAQLQQGSNVIVPLSHYPANYRWSNKGNGSLKKTPKKLLWMQWTLRRQVKERQLDVCHFTNNVAPLWIRCPSVLTIHDMTLWLYPSYHPRRRLATMRPIIPMAARQAGAIIAVSKSAKDDIVRILAVPPEKVKVIYEAPGPDFRPMRGSADLAFARKIYDLPEKFILHVGTLEPRKNLVRLLEAFAKLRLKGAMKHHLVFAGKPGWGFDNIFTAVESLGIDRFVTFLDYVPNRWLAAIYNLADVMIYPSVYEGFGLPVVEAMASGTPVITSPNGALREIADDAAAYVEPEEVSSIAEILYMVLSSRSLQTDLKELGLARSAFFSWERAARETQLLYQHVLDSSRYIDPIPFTSKNRII